MRTVRQPFRYLAGPRDHVLLSVIVISATAAFIAATHLINPDRSHLSAVLVTITALCVGTGRRTAWWIILTLAVVLATFAATSSDHPATWWTACLLASLATGALLLCPPFNPLLQRHRTLDDRRFEDQRVSNERIGAR